MRIGWLGAMLLLAAAGPSSAQSPDARCRSAAQARAEVCTADCIAKARAAVDPSMQENIYGRACAKNCLKIQMFQGQVCP